MKPQEEEEEREDNSFSENGMQCAEGVTDPRMCAPPPTHIYIYIRLTSLSSFRYALHFSHLPFLSTDITTSWKKCE